MASKKDNKFLREVIADAKTVKEMAIANARIAMEESFQPTISSMLSTKLREEEGEELDMPVDEQKELDSSEIGGAGVTVDDPAPKEPSAVASDSSDIENPGIETDTIGEAFGDDEELEDPEADLGMDLGMGDEPAPEAPMDGGDDLGLDLGAPEEDDLDLEAVIRELEADLGGLGDDEDDLGLGLGEPEDELGLGEGFDDVEAGEEVDGAIKTEAEDKAEGVFSDGKDVPAVDGVNGGTKVADLDEEIDLEEVLREMEAEDTSSKIATENAELKRTLAEYRKVLSFLKTRLTEVNMLNAKLLYTSKLFKKFNLDEGKKKQVVEAFDRASTPREVKLVFSALYESFKAGGSKKKIPASVKKITESASTAVGSTKPNKKVTEQQLTESAVDPFARWKKLAGIDRRN